VIMYHVIEACSGSIVLTQLCGARATAVSSTRVMEADASGLSFCDPAAVRIDGAIVVTALAVRESAANGAAIVVATSRDNGKTFTRPAVVAALTSRDAGGRPSIAGFAGGRILVAWVGGPKSGEGGQTELLHAESDDYGSSWMVSRHGVLSGTVSVCVRCPVVIATSGRDIVGIMFRASDTGLEGTYMVTSASRGKQYGDARLMPGSEACSRTCGSVPGSFVFPEDYSEMPERERWPFYCLVGDRGIAVFHRGGIPVGHGVAARYSYPSRVVQVDGARRPVVATYDGTNVIITMMGRRVVLFRYCGDGPLASHDVVSVNGRQESVGFVFIGTDNSISMIVRPVACSSESAVVHRASLFGDGEGERWK
jgi:hypothetical protein